MPLLTFPDTRQYSNFDCGAAATQSVAYYYGREFREDRLVKILKADPEVGVASGDIIKFFVGLGGFYVHAARMTLDEVKGWLDRKVPVILLIQAWGEPGVDYSIGLEDGHWVVAIGYDDTRMFFDDPSLLDNRGFIPFKELEVRWHAADKVYLDHYGIAIYGPKPTYDRGKTIKIESLQRVVAAWLSRQA